MGSKAIYMSLGYAKFKQTKAELSQCNDIRKLLPHGEMFK